MKAVSVDVMGGDLGASATVPAVLEVLKSNPNVSFYLVGLPEKIYSQFDRLGYSPCSRVTVVETSEVVAMDESPSKALRNKKKSKKDPRSDVRYVFNAFLYICMHLFV